MDQELTRLTTQVCDIRRQRNMLSPISRLPEEILVEIFTHGARDHHEHYRLPMPCVPAWINVSYVCHHWRIVALDCPTLWSYLFVASQWWTEELLVRSKQTSLKISLLVRQSTEKQLVAFFEKMAVYPERIQELRLGASPPAVFSLGPFARAPCLRVLAVEECDLSFSIMPRIFSGNAPALSKVKLQSIDLPWHLLPLSGLASLSLKRIPPGSHPLGMVDLLSTLSCMQNIMHLCLAEALPSARGFLSSTDFDTSQKVNLPHLSHLSIVAPLSTVVAFLSCVNIPGTTEMKLRCQEEIGEDGRIPYGDFDYYPELFTLLEQRFKSCKDYAALSPTIRTVSARYDEFVLSTSASEYNHFSARPLRFEDKERWDCNIPLRLKFNGPWELLGEVYLCVSPTDVQRTQIYNFRPSPDSWEKILRHFQELRYLKVGNYSEIFGLAPALSLVSPNHVTMESQEVYGGQGSHLLCAQALEELELADIPHWPDGGVDPHSLRAALLTRKECGRALKRLVMNNCTIDDLRDPMDIWNLPVGEVCWDGKSKYQRTHL